MLYFFLRMKQTEDDLRYAASFAAALLPHVARERRTGLTLKQIGAKLGVTEPALKKYLRGRTTPSLRTVVLAYDTYGVSVRYRKVEIVRSIASKRQRGDAKKRPELQLVLPFDISAPGLDNRLVLKLFPTGISRYQLRLTLRAVK
jgi:transcriptional regulator with XRE-family HTH domain